ncbi:hypothetical protein Tco_1172981, partial [Tanacetum coccineum]
MVVLLLVDEGAGQRSIPVTSKNSVDAPPESSRGLQVIGPLISCCEAVWIRVDLFSRMLQSSDYGVLMEFSSEDDSIVHVIQSYYDSEGDVLYLERLLSDDNTHNLSSDVFFDREPQHIENESDHVTFSPKSDPLHHEFAGSVITIPPRIVREHEDYINRMSLLCSNSSSRSPENSHTIIESLPTSTTLIKD